MIQEALAQPEQEPVAYINVEERKLEWAKPISWNTPTTVKLERIPLYTHPLQPEQEYESVLIDGVAYTIPSKVAVEILGLHLDLLQLKQEQEPLKPNSRIKILDCKNTHVLR
jgi:hypothetical protein